MFIDNTDRVLFEKPNLAQLTRQYTVVDLHFHSRYSDGHNPVAKIAQRARRLGIGVAITDHNEIRGAVEIDGYGDVLSIPGIEVTSKEGTHVLVYFYDVESLQVFYHNDIRPHMGAEIMSSTALEMEEIIKRARFYKAIIIFPHPFCGTYTGINNPYFPPPRLNSLLKVVDGVEAINAENLKKGNLRSALLGFNLNKAITGGSDGHRVSQMGRVVTYAACRRRRRAFLDAVRNRENKVVGKEIDILRKVTSNGFKLRTNLKNYPDLVEKNLRYSYTVINSRSRTIRENVKRLNGKVKEKGKKFRSL